MPDIRSTREVAEVLGVQEWEIENALRRREVPRPPVLGGNRLWDAVSVERLREVLIHRRRRVESTPAGTPAYGDGAAIGGSS